MRPPARYQWMIPWDHCPFYNQHDELVKLTGWGEEEHIALQQYLLPKEEPARSEQESGQEPEQE